MTSSLFNLSGLAVLAIAFASFLGAPASSQAGATGTSKDKAAKACCKDDKCCKDKKCCEATGADKAKAGEKKSEKKADCCTAAKCC